MEYLMQKMQQHNEQYTAPSICSSNYVSVFKIDGVPILPPLMTPEKRRMMIGLRYQAMELENKLETNRKLKQATAMMEQEDMVEYEHNEENCAEHDKTTPPSDTNESEELTTASSSSCIDNSCGVTLINVTKVGLEDVDDGSNECGAALSAQRSEIDLVQGKLYNLKKSQTLIVDNVHMENRTAENVRYYGNSPPVVSERNDPSDSLAACDIPQICIDPPTPLVDRKGFCEEEPTHNTKSEIQTYPLKCQQKAINLCEILRQEETEMRSPSKQSSNIRVTQRSATSPSLKQDPQNCVIDKLGVCNSNIHQSDHTLVRSNSFTLESPSQALLDHIRLQKHSLTMKPTSHSTTQLLDENKRSPQACSAFTRHTVQSMAKRVQKMDAKPHCNSPSRNSSIMNGNIHKRSPYELKSSGSKNKISKPVKKNVVASASQNMMPKPPNKTNLSNPILRSLENIKRPARSPHSVEAANNHHNNNNSCSNKNDSLSSTTTTPRTAEIEAEHRQKFLRLLSQQQDEQKRLQKVFEEQQQKLLQQLSTELAKTHLRSPPTKKKYNQIVSQLSNESSPRPMSSEPSPRSHQQLISPTFSESSQASFTYPSRYNHSNNNNNNSIGSNSMTSLNSTLIINSISSASSSTGSNVTVTPRRRLFSHQSEFAASAASITGSTNKKAMQQVGNRKLVTNN